MLGSQGPHVSRWTRSELNEPIELLSVYQNGTSPVHVCRVFICRRYSDTTLTACGIVQSQLLELSRMQTPVSYRSMKIEC